MPPRGEPRVAGADEQCVWARALNSRAGIPGVGGRLGVPAKSINFLEEGSFFFARKRVRKNGVFLSPFWGAFVLLGGVFALFGGVFVLFFFFFFARQRDFFLGVNFL